MLAVGPSEGPPQFVSEILEGARFKCSSDKLVEIGGTMRNGEREQPRGLSLWLVTAGLSDCPRMGAVVR